MTTTPRTERTTRHMIEVHHKTLAPTALKVGPGRVSAEFSVYGVVDLDGDVVLPGAIDDGAEIVVSQWNHGSWQPGALPLGVGRIRTTDTAAIVDADLFDTATARDTLAVLDGLGERCQWSFGYQILDSERATVDGKGVTLLTRLSVHEASPVLLGANPATRTLTVTGDEAADELLAREYARYAQGQLDRQLSAETAAIRAEMGGAA